MTAFREIIYECKKQSSDWKDLMVHPRSEMENIKVYTLLGCFPTDGRW